MVGPERDRRTRVAEGGKGDTEAMVKGLNSMSWITDACSFAMDSGGMDRYKCCPGASLNLLSFLLGIGTVIFRRSVLWIGTMVV